ncbi:hypothetical protein JVU11DRAFT_10630 [Chiua virens]|nr:hypothetical protein JVU11DRAFT_10624 [Chiua virens]KAG9309384.1 hypothetical protein JVU11DRAFT_10630 [Chiua virens]
MCEDEEQESMTAAERQEYMVFRELLHLAPGLEARLMGSSEGEVVTTAELIQRGASGARANDTKGMKSTIIDWITPKGQSLNPHIPRNNKSGHGFNHERTGALLCPVGLDWSNAETRNKLVNGQIQVAGDKWPVFLYANYSYNPEDPWNGLLRSGLLISVHILRPFNFAILGLSPSDRHSNIFLLPQALLIKNQRQHDQEMHVFTVCGLSLRHRSPMLLPRLASHLHSECFYNSILELLFDPDEKEEVDQLLLWWNWQVFPLYADIEHVPSKNSALARIRQKCVENRDRDNISDMVE